MSLGDWFKLICSAVVVVVLWLLIKYGTFPYQ